MYGFEPKHFICNINQTLRVEQNGKLTSQVSIPHPFITFKTLTLTKNLKIYSFSNIDIEPKKQGTIFSLVFQRQNFKIESIKSTTLGIVTVWDLIYRY